jgi:hypothetical protein
MNNFLLEGLDDYDVIGTGGDDYWSHIQDRHIACRNAMDVDALLRGRSGAHVHARLRTNARGGHGGVRQELAEGVGHGKGADEPSLSLSAIDPSMGKDYRQFLLRRGTLARGP